MTEENFPLYAVVLSKPFILSNPGTTTFVYIAEVQSISEKFYEVSRFFSFKSKTENHISVLDCIQVNALSLGFLDVRLATSDWETESMKYSDVRINITRFSEDYEDLHTWVESNKHE